MRRSIPAVVALVAVVAAPASACSVPVASYALDHWLPSPHMLELPAGTDAQKLNADLAGGGTNAQAITGTGDRFRVAFGGGTVWWDTPAATAEADLAVVRRSPIRQALVRRLVAGDIAAWILVRCGDDTKDAAARALLSSRCGEVERTATLPDPKAAPKEQGDTSPPLSGRYPAPVLRFARFEVGRHDPAEAGLREQILHLEPSLAQEAGPIAVAVFGRGRALPPLHGDTLTQASIDDSCLFLLGSCSCEVKEQNPGTDLLIESDWAPPEADAKPPSEPKGAP